MTSHGQGLIGEHKPFTSVGIVGLGLMGGSLAGALRGQCRSVIGVARRAEALTALSAEIGPNAAHVVADVSERDAMADLKEAYPLHS